MNNVVYRIKSLYFYLKRTTYKKQKPINTICEYVYITLFILFNISISACNYAFAKLFAPSNSRSLKNQNWRETYPRKSFSNRHFGLLSLHRAALLS